MPSIMQRPVQQRSRCAASQGSRHCIGSCVHPTHANAASRDSALLVQWSSASRGAMQACPHACSPQWGPGCLPECATCSRLTAATGACLGCIHVQLELATANACDPLRALHQVPPAAGQHPAHLHQASKVECVGAGLLQGLATLAGLLLLWLCVHQACGSHGRTSHATCSWPGGLPM